MTIIFLFETPMVIAERDITAERVRFAKGKSSAVVESRITGYDVIDYVLGARKGQYMNVSMATDNTANYFNILAPGENQVAMFNGSINQNQYEGILPESGDYKIRIYMMRSAARRKEVANYRLEMIITNVGKTPPAAGEKPADSDVLVEGTPYHATGSLPCIMASGQMIDSCLFGVIREGTGTGIVTVTKPDGSIRSIFFEKGKAIGADTNQPDSGKFRSRTEGDETIVYIGEEVYKIPNAVIFGG
jgi:hypothetical protein